jgi:uncharacterized repeat protein (TIGR01451 family)
MRLLRLTVAIGGLLAVAGGSSVLSATSATSPGARAHRCAPGFKHAVIAGRHRCLKAGQRCNRRHDREYHRYGFHCHSGRLTRRRPPPPPPPIGADLTIALADAPDPVVAGATLTYTLTARNDGPSAATDVLVVDAVAPGLPVTIASFSASQGTCVSPNAAAVGCALGTLAGGASAIITIQVTATAAGTLSNRATIHSETMVDPDLADNSATTLTTVTAPPPAPPPPPGPPPGPPPPPPLGDCHPSYPDVCIAPPPPDLHCGDIPHRNFRVIYTVPDPDPHRFDGDRDGVGCEQ